MEFNIKRCWNTKNPRYIKYHDEEWGVPVHEDQKFFEHLVLSGFQAGISWCIVLEKREAIRNSFDNFYPQKVAKYNSEDIERIMTTPGVIKNRTKIISAINNAIRFIEIQKEFGSFNTFIWRFEKREISKNTSEGTKWIIETEESRKLSFELKKRGFKFVGPVICCALMQATGLINGHKKECFRYDQIRQLKRTC